MGGGVNQFPDQALKVPQSSLVLPTNQIPFIGDYIRIVCAICNRYLKPLSKGSADEDEILGCRMLYMSKQANELKEYVENNHLGRRTACWITLKGISDFPRMDEDQLRSLTYEIYQLRLCTCYALEHLDEDCTIQVHKEETGLLPARLQSRHVSSSCHGTVGAEQVPGQKLCVRM